MEPTRDELIEVLRVLVREAYPDLAGRLACMRGRVIKVHEAGGRMGTYPPAYAVDVQLLDRWGRHEMAGPGGVVQPMPLLPNVELSPIWAGPGRGILCPPPVGALVRIGFYYADPNQPYVSAVLGDSFEVPAHPAGSLIIQRADGVRIEIEVSGTIRLTTVSGQVVLEAGTVRVEGNLVVSGTINGA